jgi:hypothetical protein
LTENVSLSESALFFPGESCAVHGASIASSWAISAEDEIHITYACLEHTSFIFGLAALLKVDEDLCEMIHVLAVKHSNRSLTAS